MPRSRGLSTLVLSTFFVSGIAGLVYQVVWTRYLALFLGHTSYAVIAVLAAFEFARPAYLRLGADGEVRSAPRELPFGAPLPEPFAGRFIARVRGAPGALSLEVRSAAGDRIGAPIPLDGARAADLAREPGGFLVAWLDDGAVVVAHLRC